MSARALRFYEQEGLIAPGRCSNGYRDYCRSTLERVRVVRALFETGLPTRLVRSVLPHLTDRPAAGAAGIGAGPLDGELLDEVRRYRERLAVRIAALDSRRHTLDVFLSRVDGNGPPPSP